MHPVIFSARHEAEARNRLTVFFRGLVTIPWFIFAALWGFVVSFSMIGAWFATLITARYPKGLYDFHASYIRFATRLHGFYWLFTDRWPSFSGDEEPDYPIRIVIPEPQAEYSRLKVFFRGFLLIPVVIVGYLMSLILNVCGLIAWFVLVFTAQLPEDLYKPMRASSAYLAKIVPYYLLMTEDWPPFWLDEPEEAARLTGGHAPAPTLSAPAPPEPPATAG